MDNFRIFISFEEHSKNKNKNLNTMYTVLPHWNERKRLFWITGVQMVLARHHQWSYLLLRVHEYMHPIFIRSLVQQTVQQLLYGKCELLFPLGISNFKLGTQGCYHMKPALANLLYKRKCYFILKIHVQISRLIKDY